MTMAWEWLTPDYERAERESLEAIRVRFPSLVGEDIFSCYSGWHGIIREYFEEVERLLADNPGSTYSLLQVKEKFGGLRLYAQASKDIQTEVLVEYDRAQDLSYKTCEACGKPGTLRKRGGWLLTRCEEHADGGVPVEEFGAQEIEEKAMAILDRAPNVPPDTDDEMLE